MTKTELEKLAYKIRQEFARSGGKSKSERKKAASAENLIKAREAQALKRSVQQV